jgi:hypothetical protein
MEMGSQAKPKGKRRSEYWQQSGKKSAAKDQSTRLS